MCLFGGHHRFGGNFHSPLQGGIFLIYHRYTIFRVPTEPNIHSTHLLVLTLYSLVFLVYRWPHNLLPELHNIVHNAAGIRTAWSLLGSAHEGQEALYLFQKHLPFRAYVHNFGQCGRFWNGQNKLKGAYGVLPFLPTFLFVFCVNMNQVSWLLQSKLSRRNYFPSPEDGRGTNLPVHIGSQ